MGAVVLLPLAAVLGALAVGGLAAARRRLGSRRLGGAGLAAALLLGVPVPAQAEVAAGTTAVTTVWGMGDSLFWQCGDSLGLGTQSSGMVGWWGGTTQDMRNRMSSTAPDWPYTTEPGHAAELANFRTAGAWVIGLGTNDVRLLTAEQYRANVEWFLKQANGRPVVWLTIYHPGYPAQVKQFNAVLRDAAARRPNLRLADWNGYAAAHPQALMPDRVHIATWSAGCQQGRFRLIRAALAAAAPPATPAPSPDPIAAEYAALGGTGGSLAAPTSGRVCGLKDDGCARYYARGAIYWSAATGAHAVTGTGLRDWVRGNWAEQGILGYPVEDTVCGRVQGGCVQRFQSGTVASSPAAGTHLLVTPIAHRWSAQGGEKSFLGYPTSETNALSGGSFALFQGGSVYWSPATGAQFVRGGIRDRWGALGWENGVLGYPTSGENCGLTRGGCFQTFQGGSIYWSPATGAQAVRDPFRAAWAARGWERSRLGYPTSGEYRVSGGIAQRFQGGVLTYRQGRVR